VAHKPEKKIMHSIIFCFDIFYVTDSLGRPLEAGNVPHYFNRPGIDALEAVLALIKES